MNTDRVLAEARTVAEYHSKFRNWDARASVRTKPRHVLDEPQASQLYFPPELHPVVDHRLVADRGPEVRHRLLVHRLYGYLRFTTELETVTVLPVAAELGMSRSGLHLPPAMRRDAFKIVTDEAWHAQFSDDLLDQVEQATGLAATLPRRPRFLHSLKVVHDGLDPCLGGLANLLFAVVSETLISSILTDLPHDQRLPPAVRGTVADHAEDEGRHHAYFRSLLRHFWGALDRAEQRAIGPVVPELIHAFLQPDLPAVALSLVEEGFTPAETEQILREAYPPERVRASIRESSTACVRYFAEVGCLDDPRTRESFVRADLLGG
ncbi:diiron oxygenase [Streptosporangium sp. NPDC049376]|uniref:diiron oxygenase n=1 Tax=Streptosporangium sp. NPDC049376 TaxID=3366192 RepID=UPI003799272D